jgi:hypothetical protein
MNQGHGHLYIQIEDVFLFPLNFDPQHTIGRSLAKVYFNMFMVQLGGFV